MYINSAEGKRLRAGRAVRNELKAEMVWASAELSTSSEAVPV
jgi:hypothetical protein